MIPEGLKLVLRKHGYQLVGSHSAAKPCSWLRKSLYDKGVCYKEQFYGIKSHLCLQCTPCVAWCQHSCLFCWRPVSFTVGDQMQGETDDPKQIVEGLIKAQKVVLTGYKGDQRINQEKLKEAMNPKHAAISLSGEPTIYPYISDLIKEFHKKGLTTFLVTNGTNPEVLEKLDELPSQLYMTLPAPDELTYKRTCVPRRKDTWNKILETVKLLPSLNTRKVIRLTLVKGLNFKDPESYAGIIKTGEPHFVEPKSFMSVGFSRERLGFDEMPLFSEIKEFSEELAKKLNYEIIDEKADSRVTLLAKEDYDWRKRIKIN